MLKFFANCSLITTLILVSTPAFSHAREPVLEESKQESSTSVQLNDEIPSLISQGFKTYCSGQHKNPAIEWTQANLNAYPNLFDSQMAQTWIKVFEELKTEVGDCIEFSFFGSHSISNNRRVIIYAESYHEDFPLPLYWKITTYNTPKGLIVDQFECSPDYKAILPPNVLIGG